MAATQNAVAPSGGPTTIAQMMVQYKDQIAAALPKHLTAERLSRIALTEIRKSKWLKEANPISLMGAIIQAAQLGLEPGNALGHCYLVPFRGDVQLILGYRGMIALARNSGQIASISAHVVYERDAFDFEYGLEERLRHVPSRDGDRGAPTHVYAIAKMAGGGVQFHVMTWAEIEAVRDKSEGWLALKAKRIKSTPWDSHPDEMARKTVVRRLFKYLPVSVEIQRAVMLDERADAGLHQQNAGVIDGEFLTLDDEEDGDGRPVTLKDQIRKKDEPKAAPTVVDFLDRVRGADDAEALDLIRSEAAESLDSSALKAVHDAIANKVSALKSE